MLAWPLCVCAEVTCTAFDEGVAVRASSDCSAEPPPESAVCLPAGPARTCGQDFLFVGFHLSTRFSPIRISRSLDSTFHIT